MSALERNNIGCSNCLQNHCKLCSFFGFFKLLLSLPELGQVQSSNFFSLLNLLLIGFDLSLQFGSQVRHAILVLPVFSLSESEFLSFALSSLESLSGFTSAGLS